MLLKLIGYSVSFSMSIVKSATPRLSAHRELDLASNLVIAVDHRKDVINYLKLKFLTSLFFLETALKESFFSSVSIDISQLETLTRISTL